MLIFEKFFLESRIWIPGNSIKSQWVSQLCGYRFQEKLRSALRAKLHTGVTANILMLMGDEWQNICPLRPLHGRVKCLDVRSTWAHGHLSSLGHSSSSSHPRRMRCVDPRILSPHFVCVCCFTSLSTSVYVKDFHSSIRIKSFQTCDGTFLTVISNSLLTEPLWSGHGGDSIQVSNFMAAYGRGNSLTTDMTDRQLRLVSLVSESQCRHPPCWLDSA